LSLAHPPLPDLFIARTLADAAAALKERGRSGVPFAGGTWIMRAPLRHEGFPVAPVSIGGIPELRRIEVLPERVSVGAAATHADIAAALAGQPDLAALAEAAGRSANPAIRAAATLGGNLCARDFAATDLVTALLCLDARVELADGMQLALAEFLAHRASPLTGLLVIRAHIPRRAARSAHARLPLRKAGDYPVAIVSLAMPDDPAAPVRVAVGSVEPVAKRWPGLEAKLQGRPLDPARAAACAANLAADFQGRDGIDAPGWYRVQVLPALVRRAATALVRGGVA
jgi:aerobic carbon-monoxide dehydrogenase medium subunit